MELSAWSSRPWMSSLVRARVLGQGVEGGGDVAKPALEAGDADVGVVGVLRDLGDQRTVEQLVGSAVLLFGG